MSQARRRVNTRGRGAFSLVELVIVVVIVGLLAAIAIPRFSAAGENAQYHAAQAALRNLREGVEMHFAEQNEYPVIDRAFFASNALNSGNPYAPEGAPLVQQGLFNDRYTDPGAKVFLDGVDMAGWWYNRANGHVRARVPDRGNAARNLAFYNGLNGTAVQALDRVNLAGEVDLGL